MSAPTDAPLTGLSPAWQVLLGVALGVVGVALLLPRPRKRRIAVGTFLTLASAVVLGVFAAASFGRPSGDTLDERIYAGLFWLFASVAVSFAVVMIAQRNPARGAMAFAVSVLATCGLFLLLAAPFLMAATVVVYAGATIVTFLFVLMLSHAGGPSDENDRSREPLLGSLGGLGFAGLVLFSLYLGSPARADAALPATPLSWADANDLKLALVAYRQAEGETATDRRRAVARNADLSAGRAVGGRIQGRLRTVAGPHAAGVSAAADAARTAGTTAVADPTPANVTAARESVELLLGKAELPARNVANLGYLLYSEHLLAVELAGTLLLVATVGAVAVAGRRRHA